MVQLLLYLVSASVTGIATSSQSLQEGELDGVEAVELNEGVD